MNHRVFEAVGKAYSDSCLGTRFVIEGIDSVRSVFRVILATRNAARPIQFNKRNALPDTAMGEMGLNATIIGRNPVAMRYWLARTA